MQTQAKSKIDAILKNIEQLGRIELDNMAIAMPLDPEIVPAIARATKDLEAKLNISLPEVSQRRTTITKSKMQKIGCFFKAKT